MISLVQIITDCQYDSNYQPEAQAKIIAKYVIEALAVEAECIHNVGGVSPEKLPFVHAAVQNWLHSYLPDPEKTHD